MKRAEDEGLHSATPYYLSEGGVPSVLPTQALMLPAPVPSGGVAPVTPAVVLNSRADDESGGARGGSLMFFAGRQPLLRLLLTAESARDLSKWLAAFAESMGPVKEKSLIQEAS